MPDTKEEARGGKRQVTAQPEGLENARTSTQGGGEDRMKNALGRLEVQLFSGPDGCVARFVGDLVDQTRMVLRETGEILRNDARVALDFSGVTSFDHLGLEAALGLVDTVRSSGGTIAIGSETSGNVEMATFGRDNGSGSPEERAGGEYVG